MKSVINHRRNLSFATHLDQQIKSNENYINKRLQEIQGPAGNGAKKNQSAKQVNTVPAT